MVHIILGLKDVILESYHNKEMQKLALILKSFQNNTSGPLKIYVKKQEQTPKSSNSTPITNNFFSAPIERP